jgi:hypothetical protein
MMRRVEITIHENADKAMIGTQLFNQWIGYAIMWGNSDYVRIYVDKDLNISTSHQRETPEGLHKEYFFMQGIYHADSNTYSFHS